MSKNGAIQDFTGAQIQCACQHFQTLQRVRVVFGFFSPLRDDYYYYYYYYHYNYSAQDPKTAVSDTKGLRLAELQSFDCRRQHHAVVEQLPSNMRADSDSARQLRLT